MRLSGFVKGRPNESDGTAMARSGRWLKGVAFALGYNAVIVAGLTLGLALGLPVPVLAFGWGFALGAVAGSGISLARCRRSMGLGLNDPPSFCPSCGMMLRWYDTIPIASWIVRWGRCRYCGRAIPAREILFELAMGLAGGIISLLVTLAEK